MKTITIANYTGKDAAKTHRTKQVKYIRRYSSGNSIARPINFHHTQIAIAIASYTGDLATPD